jgi:signal transduction histidine kinase
MKQAAEQERIKIYRDLHDDVGSRLLSIIHADTDNRLGTMARAALESLRQAVSKANTRDQALIELLDGMREETELRLHGSGHTVAWTQTAMPAVNLPSDVVFNLNRIMKELVSNIIRHANANVVEVKIAYHAAQLTITVSDNGCGMQSKTGAHDGNGLNNIFSRAQEINAVIDISSNLISGTRTQLTLPLLTDNTWPT